MGTNDRSQNKAEELKGQGKEALGRATGDEELGRRQDRPGQERPQTTPARR